MKTGKITLVAALLMGGSAAFASPRSVDELNELLRGELSAVETYRQALEKVGTQPEAMVLKDFMSDHQAVVTSMRSHIKTLGGVPSEDSGAWGMWAKTVTGTAKLLGDAAALKALREGEQHGLEEHREVLADADVPAGVKEEIKTTYIPKLEQRIEKLDEMIKKLS